MTKIEQLLNDIKGLNLLESAELAKALEEVFGVTATMAAAPAAGQQEATAPKAEEKDAWNVKLTGIGGNKIEVIKALRKVKKDLGLSEAKKAVEEAPTMIGEGVSKVEAEEMKKTLEAAGATVELS
jgi:large subunit ribosomal protein L7/L12